MLMETLLAVTLIKEILIASNYEVETLATSQIDPTKQVIVKTEMRCPKCKRLGPGLEHGKPYECPKCHLKMTRWGNGLDCELEKK